MLERIYYYYKKLDTHYARSIMWSTLLAGIIIPILFAVGFSGLGFAIIGLPLFVPVWLVSTWLFNNIVSGASYFGTMLDYLKSLFSKESAEERKRKGENILTTIGIVIVTPIMVVISALYSTLLHGIQAIGVQVLTLFMTTVRLMGISGGTGTRWARAFIDNYRAKSLRHGETDYNLAIILTTITAIVLAGVFIPFTGPLSLLFAFIFVCNVVSGASYIGRVSNLFDRLLDKHLPSGSKTNLQEKYWERRLTAVGILMGLAVGFALLSLGVTISFFPPAVVFLAMLLVPIGVFGGGMNRWGKLLDMMTAKKDPGKSAGECKPLKAGATDVVLGNASTDSGTVHDRSPRPSSGCDEEPRSENGVSPSSATS